MNKKLKIGIVSFGYSTKIFHAPFLFKSDYYELYAVLERSKSESITYYPSIKLYRDYDDFLNDANIDIVIITTPNYTHYELTKRALLAKKNVVVDKPFVVNLDEAIELVNLAKKNNVLLTVYQNRRYDGDYLTVKNVIEKECLGTIFEFYSFFDRYKENPILRWREMKLPGSGLVYDIGSHLVDQAIKLFGAPNSLFAINNKLEEMFAVEDYFFIVFEYKRFKLFLGAGNKYIDKRPRFAIFGNKGSFIKKGLDPQENALKIGSKPLKEPWIAEHSSCWGVLKTLENNVVNEERIKTIPGNYMYFYDNLYNHLVNSAPIEVTYADMLLNTYIIDKIYKSIHNGTKEYINDDFRNF